MFRFDGTNIVRADTSHHSIESLAEDREGNIWVGTGGGGLNRLRRRVLELEGTVAGLPFEAVRSVCQDASGALWAVGETGELGRRQDGAWRSVSTNESWSGAQATCVASDLQGAVWIGTHRSGLQRWQDGVFTVLNRRDGLAGGTEDDVEGHMFVARLHGGPADGDLPPAADKTPTA